MEPQELRMIPPQAIDAEQSLLGGLLMDNSTLPDAISELKGDEFYKDSHRRIYAAICELFEASTPADIVTVSDKLDQKRELEAAGGASYLAQLTDCTPSSKNAPAYAGIVHEKAMRRKLIQIANETLSYAYANEKPIKEVMELAESSIFAIAQRNLTNGYNQIRKPLVQNIAQVERALEYRDQITGIPSYYTELDRLTAGFQKSDLIIIAARPAMGKTALAVCIARNIAANDRTPVGFFSLEMSAEQLSMRLLCMEARVDSQKIRTGCISQKEGAKLLAAAGECCNYPILIDDTASLSALDLRARARRMKRDWPDMGLVIVDYLQLMRGPSGTERREQEISEISRSLKGLAKELDLPVIALSQLNRKVEERADKRPLLSDLRESGAIEQDADVIAFIYRDEIYDRDSPNRGIAELIVSKQRKGPTGTVNLAYIDTYTRFETLTMMQY
jgi:replicative DNA helicase